jgi:hypothetical protein
MPSVFIVMNFVIASGWVSGGDVESSVLLPLHARTHSLIANTTQKKFVLLSKLLSVKEEDVTYGIRAGSTRDLGSATTFVDMSWFYLMLLIELIVRKGNVG